MAFGFYFGKDAHDLSTAIDHKGSALNSFHLPAVHILFFEDAKGLADLLLAIGEQGVRQVVFLFKLFLGLGRIGRDTQDPRSGLLDFFECVAEPARFNGSAGGICLRIEEEHDHSALKVMQ